MAAVTITVLRLQTKVCIPRLLALVKPNYMRETPQKRSVLVRSPSEHLAVKIVNDMGAIRRKDSLSVQQLS